MMMYCKKNSFPLGLQMSQLRATKGSAFVLIEKLDHDRCVRVPSSGRSKHRNKPANKQTNTQDEWPGGPGE